MAGSNVVGVFKVIKKIIFIATVILSKVLKKGNQWGLDISIKDCYIKAIIGLLKNQKNYIAISVINRIYNREAFGKRRIA